MIMCGVLTGMLHRTYSSYQASDGVMFFGTFYHASISYQMPCILWKRQIYFRIQTMYIVQTKKTRLFNNFTESPPLIQVLIYFMQECRISIPCSSRNRSRWRESFCANFANKMAQFSRTSGLEQSRANVSKCLMICVLVNFSATLGTCGRGGRGGEMGPGWGGRRGVLIISADRNRIYGWLDFTSEITHHAIRNVVVYNCQG